MNDDFMNNLAARLNALELMAASHHTPLPEVSRQDVKRLREDLDALKGVIKATQADIASRTAGLATVAGVQKSFGRLLPEVIVPLLGDSLVIEKKAREQHVKDTLGSIHAEITAIKNAASAHAMHSADYLRAKAAHFARG